MSSMRSPGGFAHPPDLPVGLFLHRVEHRVGADRAGTQIRVDADDVGFACGDREHSLAAAPDQHRRPARLHGLGVRRVVGDAVVLAVIRELLAGETLLHDVQRLFEPVDAHRRRVVGQTEHVVVGSHPPGAEAELQATVGKEVDRRRFLGQDRRMLVIVVEHQRADAQRGGVRGSHRDRRHRCQLVAEVVGHEEG